MDLWLPSRQFYPEFSRRRISADSLHGAWPSSGILYDDNHHRSGCTLADADSRNAAGSDRRSPSICVAYYGCAKSMGAIVYSATLVPLVRWTKPRLQLRVALVLVTIALLYPALRFTGVFPTNGLVEAATLIDKDRGQSLKDRFYQEQMLLEHSYQRFLFGWGGWGRNRNYGEYWGEDITVTDGDWIITLSGFGLFGFVAQFGLLAFPVIRAASALKYARSEHDKAFLAALALIVAITLIDQLPNSTLSPWSWLLAGALLGRAEALQVTARQLQNSVVRKNSTSRGNATPRLQGGGLTFKRANSDRNQFR